MKFIFWISKHPERKMFRIKQETFKLMILNHYLLLLRGRIVGCLWIIILYAWTPTNNNKPRKKTVSRIFWNWSFLITILYTIQLYKYVKLEYSEITSMLCPAENGRNPTGGFFFWKNTNNIYDDHHYFELLFWFTALHKTPAIYHRFIS